jgi:hypothetical protein
MGTFILKRKYFADSENNSGSNLGKIALGTGIAAAGAFAAGRRGLLGKNIAKSTNVAWGKLGNTLGNVNMVENAASRYRKHGLGLEANKQTLKSWKERGGGYDKFISKVGADDLILNNQIKNTEAIEKWKQTHPTQQATQQ